VNYRDKRAAENRASCEICGTSDNQCTDKVVVTGKACCPTCANTETHEPQAILEKALAVRVGPPPEPKLFDGVTIDPALDNARLGSQIERVYSLMSDGKWRTLPTIAVVVKGSEAGVSARLRDLRKPWWGAHTVERRRTNSLDGLQEYKLMPAICGLLDGHRSENPRLAARERITAFLDARDTMSAMHPDIVHSVHTVDGSYDLLVSDLREMLK